MGSDCSSGDVGAGRGRRRRRMGEIMGQKNEERRGARMKISVSLKLLKTHENVRKTS